MTARYLSIIDERTIDPDVPNAIFDITVPKNEMWTIQAVISNGEESSDAPVFGKVVLITRDSPIEVVVDDFSWTGKGTRRAGGVMVYGSEDRCRLFYSSSDAITIKTLIVILVETNVPSLPYVPPVPQ